MTINKFTISNKIKSCKILHGINKIISISKTKNKIMNKKNRKEKDFRLNLSLIIPHSKTIFLLKVLSQLLPSTFRDTKNKTIDTIKANKKVKLIILVSPSVHKGVQK